mgnify:CR=1 FL=1
MVATLRKYVPRQAPKKSLLSVDRMLLAGVVGLQRHQHHGLLHSEVFADFGQADVLRPLLWERIRNYGRNHGLARLWMRETSQSWRLLGFDMPGHGRSPLPPGEPNWVWRLSEQRYKDTVLRYLDALGLERVALMGCSMGAAIGLALLARHPDR